jgi:GH24 family phage-related lysozyme (muramidase)
VVDIAYGHNIMKGEEYLLKATLSPGDATSMKLLRNDINRLLYGPKGLRAVLGPMILTQTQFDALVLLAYNAGTGAITAELLNSINQNDRLGILSGFLIHTRDRDGVFRVGLLARRQAELDLFFGRVSTPQQFMAAYAAYVVAASRR